MTNRLGWGHWIFSLATIFTSRDRCIIRDHLCDHKRRSNKHCYLSWRSVTQRWSHVAWPGAWCTSLYYDFILINYWHPTIIKPPAGFTSLFSIHLRIPFFFSLHCIFFDFSIVFKMVNIISSNRFFSSVPSSAQGWDCAF